MDKIVASDLDSAARTVCTQTRLCDCRTKAYTMTVRGASLFRHLSIVGILTKPSDSEGKRIKKTGERWHLSYRHKSSLHFLKIDGDGQKSLFLRTASFYLFLVKRGDWMVDVPGSDRIVDYLTNTYKYVGIFSLIESLSNEKFIDFYQFLIRQKSAIPFPITDKKALDPFYKRYKADYGSIKKGIAFFRALSPVRQDALISRLEVRGTDPYI